MARSWYRLAVYPEGMSGFLSESNSMPFRAIRKAVVLFTAFAALRAAADPVSLAADNLKNAQITSGPNAGSWVDDQGNSEKNFTGPSCAGLIAAYLQNGSSAYLSSATAAANFIVTYETNLSSGTPNYVGDEAYALARLTEVGGNTSYAVSVKNFYDSTVRGRAGGTNGYISQLESNYTKNGLPEHSQATFYLAEHTLAAYAAQVNAIDKAAWRNAMIQELGDVTNSDLFPVEATGVALFALASTGPLDSTLVNPSAQPGSFWNGVKLSDLPGIVARQQVTTGLKIGSFNDQLDNPAAGTGFAEDAAFATLGLIGAEKQNFLQYNYSTQILAAQNAMFQGEDATGAIHQDLYDTTTPHFNYINGEVLQATPEPACLALLGLGALSLRRRRAQPLPPLV